MTDPGDATEHQSFSGPHVPRAPTDAFGRPLPPQPLVPLPVQQPDPALLRRWDREEKSHKPAAIIAGLASGTVGTTIIGTTLSAAKYNCGRAEVDIFGNQTIGPLCPYVMVPGFDVTVWSLILGFVLAGVGYAAVYAIVYLSHALRG